MFSPSSIESALLEEMRNVQEKEEKERLLQGAAVKGVDDGAVT